MRVLIVISGLRYGGAEKQIIESSKELARRGHVVAIYTLTADVPRLPELNGSGIEVIVDDKRGKLDFAVLRRLRRFIQRFGAEIVHGYLYDGNIYSRVAALGLGIPVLNAERNDNYALRRSQVWPHKLTKHLADGVVANTWAGRDFAKRLFGFGDDRMHVVWNGVRLADVEARISTRKKNYAMEFFGRDDVRMACLVGTILPSKDFLLALEVADCLTRRDATWRVLFIGDPIQKALSYQSEEVSRSWDYHSQVMARFDALKLAGRAAFAGERADALEILSQSDVLFSTSVHEGFPNVVLEAMSAGVPVVSMDYSDIRRILPFPWQVVARSPEAMTDAILHATGDRAAIAARQLAWVRENATIERATDTLETIYQRYVGHRQ
jgi:glycosyltransferase involved in cell wall biosynthesis